MCSYGKSLALEVTGGREHLTCRCGWGFQPEPIRPETHSDVYRTKFNLVIDCLQKHDSEIRMILTNVPPLTHCHFHNRTTPLDLANHWVWADSFSNRDVAANPTHPEMDIALENDNCIKKCPSSAHMTLHFLNCMHMNHQSPYLETVRTAWQQPSVKSVLSAPLRRHCRSHGT